MVATAERLYEAYKTLWGPEVRNSTLAEGPCNEDGRQILVARSNINCCLLNLVGMTGGRISRIRTNRRLSKV